jgi:hypothetical protein
MCPERLWFTWAPRLASYLSVYKRVIGCFEPKRFRAETRTVVLQLFTFYTAAATPLCHKLGNKQRFKSRDPETRQRVARNCLSFP